MPTKKKDNKDAAVPVVFTVAQDQQTFWVLIACPAGKVDELATSYVQMLNSNSETDLESILEKIGAEVRDYGPVEDIVENGQVIGQKIPDHIKDASRVIGQEEDDPELGLHPQNYLPGNDNSP